MNEILSKCVQVSSDPYTFLDQWKKQNKKKIICCYPMYIPEEIIHAAGMLPVIAWRGNEPVTLGHSHIPPYNCGLTRSFIDDLVREKLGFFDGIVIHRLCLQAQGLPFIIEQNIRMPYLEFLSLPALFEGPAVRDFLIQELERFKAGLEKYGGQKITDSALKNSIRIYNRNRQLLNKLYEIRRQKPGIITAREMMAVIQTSMLMPKEDNNQLLEGLIAYLEKKEYKSDLSKLRVILTGSLCQTPHLGILDLIEEQGMEVVDDDLYVGSRYFANEVKEDGNPIESLADRYMSHTPPCPTKADHEHNWATYVIEMAERNKAQGVISLLVRYCPPHLCYYPDIKTLFEERGIPELMIEVEHEIVSLEQVKTRVQSFKEILGGI